MMKRVAVLSPKLPWSVPACRMAVCAGKVSRLIRTSLRLVRYRRVAQLVFELGAEVAAVTRVVIVCAHQRGRGLEGFLDRGQQGALQEVVWRSVFLGDLEEGFARRQAKLRAELGLCIDVAQEHDGQVWQDDRRLPATPVVLDVRLQRGLDPDGAAPDRAASEPLGGIAHVLDHFLFAEDRAHVGHLTRFVVEEHVVEQHGETAKGEHREGEGSDELAVEARDGEFVQWHGVLLVLEYGMLAVAGAHCDQVGQTPV